MVDQLELIAELAGSGQAGVEIGIIPWWQSVDAFPVVEINLYDERAVIINTGNGVSHITQPPDVAGFVAEFRHLCGLARFGEDAAVEARRIAADHRTLLDSAG